MLQFYDVTNITSDFCRNADEKVLTDNQAILVKDGKTKLIGKGKEIKL